MDENKNNILYEWSIFPATQNLKVTIIVVFFIIIVSIGIGLFMGNFWFYSVFSFVVLFLSLLSFFTKTKYIFTDEEVIVKGLINRRHRKWTEFRSYYFNDKGILLSPFAVPSRLENFRGQYLLWTVREKDDVLSIVKEKIKSDNAAKSE